MARRRSCLALLVLLIASASAEWKSRDSFKRSLVMVFDTTGSMSPELAQVKAVAEKIVNQLTSNPKTNIVDFILAEFNDPVVPAPFVTSSATLFKERLNAITVTGGDDCPEMAITGLEKALAVAKPGSLIFLFTDADAKDYAKAPSVLTKLRTTGAHFNALLTSSCGSKDAPGYTVYGQLARLGRGQVFDVNKSNIDSVLSSFLSQLSPDHETLLTRRLVGPRVFNFHTDSSMEFIEIKVTGTNPRVRAFDPYNNEVTMARIVDLPTVLAGKLPNTVTGKWMIFTNAEGDYSVSVEAITKIHFESSVESAGGDKSRVLLKKPSDVKEMRRVVVIAENPDKTLFTRFQRLEKIGDVYRTGVFKTPPGSFDIVVEATDKDGKTFARTITSDAKEPVAADLSAREVVEGTRVKFLCDVGEGNTTWSFDGRLLMKSGAKLELRKLSESDSGLYTCVRGGNTKNFKIAVVARPRIEFVNSKRGLRNGVEVKLRCTYQSRSAVEVTWVDKRNNTLSTTNELSLIFNADMSKKRVQCKIKAADYNFSTPLFSMKAPELTLAELRHLMRENDCYEEIADSTKPVEELKIKYEEECNESY